MGKAKAKAKGEKFNHDEATQVAGAVKDVIRRAGRGRWQVRVQWLERGVGIDAEIPDDWYEAEGQRLLDELSAACYALGFTCEPQPRAWNGPMDLQTYLLEPNR